MDFYSAVGLISVIIPVAAAVAAAFSAAIAYQANRNLAKADRKRRVREVSLLAHKVEAAATDVDELGAQLKLAYEALFIFAGQGARGSGLGLYTDEIKKKRDAVMPMQQAARELLESDREKLTDEQATSRLLEFDGSLARIDRIRGRFREELGSVESQNSTYRQKILGHPS